MGRSVTVPLCMLLWGGAAGGCSDASPSKLTLQLGEYAHKFAAQCRPLPDAQSPDAVIPAAAWLRDVGELWEAHENQLLERFAGELSGGCFSSYSTLPEYAEIEAARESIQAGGFPYWRRFHPLVGGLLTGTASHGLLFLPYLYPSNHETFFFYQDLLQQILRHGTLFEIESVINMTSVHSTQIARASLGRALQSLDAPVVAGLLYEEGLAVCLSLVSLLRADFVTEKEVRQLLPALDDLWNLAARVKEGQVDWPSLGRNLAAIADSGLGAYGTLLGLDWESLNTLY
jgi:hypothetical protein